MAVPPPVPALPDTPRITTYTASASSGPFGVGFALYGDSTDYGDWLQVFLDDAELVAVTDYQLTSPSGPITTLPRPITDAVITLTSASTGRLTIIGARRPRRTSQFTESRGVAARDLNQVLSDIIAQNREAWDFRDRVPALSGGSTFGPLSLTDPEPGKILQWNATGTGLEGIENSTIPPGAYPIATESEAEAGTSNTTLMTPLRTAQYVGPVIDAKIISQQTYFNAYEEGIIGDGSTINDAAMRVLIDKFPVLNSGHSFTRAKVVFPVGKYLFADQATFNLTGNYGLTFEGEGSSNAIFAANSTSLVYTGTGGGSFWRLLGTEGIEISHMSIYYSDPGFIGNLIYMDTVSGGILCDATHIHNFAMRGIGGANSAATLIRCRSSLKTVIEHGFMLGASVGITANDDSQVVNCLRIDDVWFDQFGTIPLILGGQNLNLTNNIFEPRADGTSVAVQTYASGVLGMNYVNNRHDDGGTVGTWFNVNNGPILNGFFAANFFRNGARAMNLGSSKALTLLSNQIYALENTPPIVPGTATEIVALAHKLTTDSGNNIPGLFTALPGGRSIVDNCDGNGIRYTGGFGLVPSKATNGYRYLPDGMLEQWMTVTVTTSAANYNWPIPFPTACLNAQVSTKGVNASDNVSIGPSGFNATAISLIGSGSLTALIRAVGY